MKTNEAIATVLLILSFVLLLVCVNAGETWVRLLSWVVCLAACLFALCVAFGRREVKTHTIFIAAMWLWGMAAVWADDSITQVVCLVIVAICGIFAVVAANLESKR